ncbi:MAG TPA: matrixin family metalloprotease [Polyangia bacterium]
MSPSRALVVALVLVAAPAAGFHVNTTDDGRPLHWPAAAVRYQLDPAGGAPVAADAFGAAVDAAFAAWATVPGGDLALEPGPAAAGGFGYDPDGPNANVVRWELENWDYEPDAVMLTFTHYRVSDGAIVDADILINGVDHDWRADQGASGGFGEEDLQNALTHEAGHFVGLGHSPEHPEAAMFPTVAPGEVSKRRLAADDEAGFAAIYAVAGAGPAAGSEDADPFRARGCDAGGGARRAPGAAAVAALLLLAWAAARRRGAAAVALLALLGTGSAAASVRYLPVDTTAARAEAVLHGRVVAVQSLRVGRLIVTDTTLAVGRCWRGRCGGTVTVRQLGGEVDGVGLHVEGRARTQVGEELVVFLRRSRAGAWAPVGMLQGVFRVRRTGRAVEAVREVATPGPARVEALPLAELARRVRGR